MPTGVYKRSEETLRKLREIAKKKRKKRNDVNNNAEENILHPAIEFLEKMKEKEDVDVNLVNGWQSQVKSLGESIKYSFDEWYKNKHKPVRKVWFLAIKAEEEILKKCEEKHNEKIEQLRDEFPNAKITMSLCKDIMIRNELGRFEVIKEEKG